MGIEKLGITIREDGRHLFKSNEVYKRTSDAAPVMLDALIRMVLEPEYVHGFDDPCDCPRCQAISAIEEAAEMPFDEVKDLMK